MTEVLEPAAVVRAVSTFGLGDLGAAEPFTLDDERWTDFLTAIRNERLGGLAVAAIDAGLLELRDERATELVERHRGDMARCLALERTLLEVAAAFEDAGVAFIVLKGPALARSVYPDPSWRPFADIDLLVRTRDWRRACGVLEAMGCVRRLPEPRAGFDERFGKAAVHTTPNNQEIDLHRTLVLGPFGLWIAPDELFVRTVPFDLTGRRLRRLDDADLLLHACIHAALGQRFAYGLQLRDIRQVLSVCEPDADVLMDRAERWHLAAAVRRAFVLEAGATGAAWPVELRGVLGSRPAPRERRLLDAYASERRGRGGPAVTTLRAIPGVRDRLAYAMALAFPRREFLEKRGHETGRRGRLARLRVPLRWVAARSAVQTSGEARIEEELP